MSDIIGTLLSRTLAGECQERSYAQVMVEVSWGFDFTVLPVSILFGHVLHLAHAKHGVLDLEYCWKFAKPRRLLDALLASLAAFRCRALGLKAASVFGAGCNLVQLELRSLTMSHARAWLSWWLVLLSVVSGVRLSFPSFIMFHRQSLASLYSGVRRARPGRCAKLRWQKIYAFGFAGLRLRPWALKW